MNAGFVTDTHPLIHYFCDGGRKLSPKVKSVFQDTLLNKTKIIYVPAAVLWEVSILLEKDRVELTIPFKDWMYSLFKNPMLLPLPFDETTISYCHGLTFHDDLFDRAIVASALQLGLPLITNDYIMHSKRPCTLYWD